MWLVVRSRVRRLAVVLRHRCYGLPHHLHDPTPVTPRRRLPHRHRPLHVEEGLSVAGETNEGERQDVPVVVGEASAGE